MSAPYPTATPGSADPARAEIHPTESAAGPITAEVIADMVWPPRHLVQAPPRSAAQDAASRANARASTGPRTRLGKLRIRHNGVRHGLYAATAPMIGERRKDYARLHDTLVAELKPGAPLEDMLVSRAAALLWRLGRAPAAENALFESFAREAARALRPDDEAVDAPFDEDGADEAEEAVGVDLLWGLAFRAGLADSPVNRIARWERSLHLQLREVMAELDRRQQQRRAAEQEAAKAAAAAARAAAIAAAEAEAEAEHERTHTVFEDVDDDAAYALLDRQIALRNNAFTRRELEDEVIRLRAALSQREGLPPSLLPLHAAGDELHRSFEEVFRKSFTGHPPGTVANGRWEPDGDEVERLRRLVRETIGSAAFATPGNQPSP